MTENKRMGEKYAEGAVRTQRKASGLLSAVFCNVCIMPRGKRKRMTTYVVEVK